MDAKTTIFTSILRRIGQEIKKARTSKGMTKDELARIIDYDPRYLQAIENGEQKPSLLCGSTLDKSHIFLFL